MFQNVKSIAMLLDLAALTYKGKRFINIVKSQLIEFVRTFDEEDLFYLYQPTVIDVLSKRGDQIGAIGNFDTDGYKIQDLNYAFKQTYYILAAQDEDSKRVLCYLTNRFSQDEVQPLKKLFNIPRTLSFEDPCEFLVIALGDKCDIPLLQGVCDGHAKILEVEDPYTLNDKLQEFFPEDECTLSILK